MFCGKSRIGLLFCLNEKKWVIILKNIVETRKQQNGGIEIIDVKIKDIQLPEKHENE